MFLFQSTYKFCVEQGYNCIFFSNGAIMNSDYTNLQVSNVIEI